MGEFRADATGATLGAIVTGVDLSALDDAEWQAIEAAFHEHALLLFPGQHLTSEAQVCFGLRFGEIEHLFGDTGIVPISNQRLDGSLMEDHEPAMEIMRGNEGWHTDSSYMPLAAKASVLSARVVPPSGGETEWADMRAAWDALDDETRGKVADPSPRPYLIARMGNSKSRSSPDLFDVADRAQALAVGLAVGI